MKIIVDNYFNNSPIGCFLEADLQCSDKLYNLHRDLPLVN